MSPFTISGGLWQSGFPRLRNSIFTQYSPRVHVSVMGNLSRGALTSPATLFNSLCLQRLCFQMPQAKVFESSGRGTALSIKEGLLRRVNCHVYFEVSVSLFLLVDRRGVFSVLHSWTNGSPAGTQKPSVCSGFCCNDCSHLSLPLALP